MMTDISHHTIRQTLHLAVYRIFYQFATRLNKNFMQNFLSEEAIIPNTSPSSSPEFLLLIRTSFGTGHPFGLFGSAVPAVSPHSLLPTPRLLAVGERVKRKKKRESLHALQALLSNRQHCCVSNKVLVTNPKLPYRGC